MAWLIELIIIDSESSGLRMSLRPPCAPQGAGARMGGQLRHARFGGEEMETVETPGVHMQFSLNAGAQQARSRREAYSMPWSSRHSYFCQYSKR